MWFKGSKFWLLESEIRTLVRFTLKAAKHKVEVQGWCHLIHNILRHLQTHTKKPQVAATFWDDAILIFVFRKKNVSTDFQKMIVPFSKFAFFQLFDLNAPNCFPRCHLHKCWGCLGCISLQENYRFTNRNYWRCRRFEKNGEIFGLFLNTLI